MFTLAGIVALLTVAFTVWPWTPLGDVVDLTALYRLIPTADRPDHIALAVFGLFALSAVLFLPITPLVVAVIVAFGPILGALWALVGLTVAAQIGFFLGRKLGQRDVVQLRHSTIHSASRFMRRHGILKTAILRVIPIAHFNAASFALGASHVRWYAYTVGTALGGVITLLTISFLYERTAALLARPTLPGLLLLAGIALFFGILLIWIQRRGQSMFNRARVEADDNDGRRE